MKTKHYILYHIKHLYKKFLFEINGDDNRKLEMIEMQISRK